MATNRIFITGNAGAGKSTLARDIARTRSLPCGSLDSIVWGSGWKKTPAHERDSRIQDLIASQHWIIEGVSSMVERAADVVIFLDVPPAVCTLRCARRNLPYLFRSRPGLPADCPEILIVPKLLKIIWSFNRNIRPGILSRKAQPNEGQTYFHVQSADDLSAALDRVAG